MGISILAHSEPCIKYDTFGTWVTSWIKKIEVWFLLKLYNYEENLGSPLIYMTHYQIKGGCSVKSIIKTRPRLNLGFKAFKTFFLLLAYWTILDHIGPLLHPVYLDPSILNFLFGTRYFDPYIWTGLLGPFYLDQFILDLLFWSVCFDPSIWTNLFVPVYFYLSLCICLFGTVYLDPSFWTFCFRPHYFDPSIWICLFVPVYFYLSLCICLSGTVYSDPSI